MKNQRSPREEDSISKSAEPDVPEPARPPQGAESVSERLERLEAALRLVTNHLEVSTRATRLLGVQQSRATLAAIVFAISATSILALSAFAALLPGLAMSLLRLSGGMSLLLLASAFDLWSGSFLRKALDKAVLEPEDSQLALELGPWPHIVRRSYWDKIRQKSPDLFYYYLVRYLSLAIYIVGLLFLLWALVLLPS